MPYVHNPSGIGLLCQPIHRVIAPSEEVEVTDAEATAIARNVFVVTDAPLPVTELAATLKPEDSEETEAGEDSDPSEPRVKRAYTRRGSQIVEQDDAPEVETR